MHCLHFLLHCEGYGSLVSLVLMPSQLSSYSCPFSFEPRGSVSLYRSPPHHCSRLFWDLQIFPKAKMSLRKAMRKPMTGDWQWAVCQIFGSSEQVQFLPRVFGRSSHTSFSCVGFLVEVYGFVLGMHSQHSWKKRNLLTVYKQRNTQSHETWHFSWKFILWPPNADEPEVLAQL